MSLPNAEIQSNNKVFKLNDDTIEILGIKGNGNQLYIRDEWIKFMEICKKEWNQNHHIIILGTPGNTYICNIYLFFYVNFTLFY